MREDVVAVLALSALVLLGLVEPAEALSGFGSNAIVSIVALLIVSAGLVRSGAVNWIAARIQDLAGGKKKSLLILSFLIPGILSGFINIVGAVSVLIGAMYSFGGAMEESGAAEQLAHLLSVSLNHFNPLVGLLVVGGVCMALTQLLHNAIVAVIMTPVALDFANSINANPRTFAVAVIVGASATFLMPVGHPASVLVQKPGSYRPKDYFIFGIGPCLIALATIGIVVPWIWPFDQ